MVGGVEVVPPHHDQALRAVFPDTRHRLREERVPGIAGRNDDFVQELFDQNFRRSDDRLNIMGAFWDIVNETTFYNKEKFDFDVYPNPSNKEVNESVRDYL